MGSREYANAIIGSLDPTGKLFHDRILSRDESGSINFKTLQRIFPCNDSMVVILDDRGDVWNWSDSLIPILPCKKLLNFR